MSNDKSDGTIDTPDKQRRLLTIGLAVAAVVILFVTTVAIILIFALRSDVAILEDQARKTAKATKSMQDELASLKENLQARKSPALANAGARAANIDAADTARDCVIRPGDKGGVANCLDAGPKERH